MEPTEITTKQTQVTELTLNGKRQLTAFVDTADLKRIGAAGWYIDGKGYVRRNIKHSDGTRSTELMHRAIMGDAPEGLEIDHINRDPSDNRRANLRFCTRSQNLFNRRTFKNNTTGFKGVRKHSAGGYVVYVGATSAPGSYKGHFKDLEEAQQVRLAHIEAIGVIC